MEWMILPYKRYADFRGRSCRKEYWMFSLLWLVVLIVGLVLAIAAVDAQPKGSSDDLEAAAIVCFVLLSVFFIASIIPSIAVTVRRFHDQGHSGWFYLFGLIPSIGGIIIIVFMCIEGTRGPNQFGADPLNPDADADIFA